MELTRKQVIETLSDIDKAYRNFTPKEIQSLEYAIKSLKTDEAYQLMYEGKEVFTKEEILTMLDKLRYDLYHCDGGEGWLKIDGELIYTDVGFALEGIDIFIRLLKQRKGWE